MSTARCRLPLVVAVLIGMAGLASAGPIFPFESCVTNTTMSPYYATRTNYTENKAKKTSQFCLQIHVRPSCTPGGRRCCNTAINKIKFFPSPGCRSSLSSATIISKKGNKTVTSIYWEVHSGYDIVKITPLMQWLSDPASADGALICVNLRAPCWTLPMLSFDKDVLEYALYDKKVSNYECCPVGALDVPLPPMPPFYPADGPSEPPSGTASPSPSPTPSPSPSPKPSPSPSPKPSPSPSPKRSPPPPPSPPPPSPSPPRRKLRSPPPPPPTEPSASPPPTRIRKRPPPMGR